MSGRGRVFEFRGRELFGTCVVRGKADEQRVVGVGGVRDMVVGEWGGCIWADVGGGVEVEVMGRRGRGGLGRID